MKKRLYGSLALTLAAAMALSACGNNGNNGADASAGTSSKTATSSKATKLVFWTFNELHQKFFESMAVSWNKANPNEQIKLEATTFPYDDAHNKLLVSLQSGKGGPDLADIEISKIGNYLKGEPQLAPLNDIVEPEKDNLVMSRLDNYAKDGQYYGIDYHVGAQVIYYNKEILDQAGVNPDDIVTWDDYEKAGKQVLEKTGKPMTTVETGDQWTFWPMVVQHGSDFLDKSGNVTLNSAENVEALAYLQKLVKEKVAVLAPGGIHHAEEYYGFMNKGGAASVWMPMWYMGRFTDYMQDLKGKMIIKPMPVFKQGEMRSSGMGGTGTVITKQSKNQELAKKFLAYAKLSKEGNIEIWKQLGFDPIRSDVWTDPAMQEPNKYTDYFGKDIFTFLSGLKSEIAPTNIGEKTPAVSDAVKTKAMFQALSELKDPKQVLDEAAASIK
ncbi:arabinosaccharide transport system substrate-binding protein [Cohnella sp. OV330]|uniref:ABC transporter substrate-binding protein n=1 Tax=Cohnella sp. OV330 TaxID=1855288 RepID=UPI0008EA5BB0|nr:sugar ABC transporter substrate-binding protein [Cohnella sp. OV330]SFB50315.1 arabinosaccharide transport system substrate-binding protein [Cohnella sp. OV330]